MYTANKILGNKYIYAYQIRQIPIKEANKKQQTEIIKIVNEIMQQKRDNQKADITKLENKIESLVYNLYKIPKNRIDVIENKT